MRQFISSKIFDASWHLVIQFTAGLLPDFAVGKEDFVDHVLDILINRVGGNRRNETKIVLLIMSFLFELNDDAIMTKVVDLLDYNCISKEISLVNSGIAPAEFMAIVYFLNHLRDALMTLSMHLSRINMDGFSELENLHRSRCPRKLTLNLCKLGDAGLKLLLESIFKVGYDSLKKNDCTLTSLTVEDDIILLTY